MESDEQEAYIYSSNSSGSGATLGSILGDVLEESRSRIEEKEDK